MLAQTAKADKRKATMTVPGWEGGISATKTQTPYDDTPFILAATNIAKDGTPVIDCQNTPQEAKERERCLVLMRVLMK